MTIAYIIGGMGIDDQTWNDLLLDQYCEHIAPQASPFARGSLRRRLRLGAAATAPLAAADAAAAGIAVTRQRIQALLADGTLNAAVSAACRPLSEGTTSVAPHLFAAASSAACAPPGDVSSAPAGDLAPRWAPHLWLLPVVFLLTAISGLFWWPLWTVTLSAWLLLMALQVAYHGRMQMWQSVVHSLQAMLHAHASLAAIQDTPLLAPFHPAASEAAKLRRQLARTVLARLPLASEYLDWILLDNLKHYFRTRRLVAANTGLLRDSYHLVSDMDADHTLASHLQAASTFCWARQAGTIDLQQVVHPLLGSPQPLTIALENGAFISGQNGSGKSTLLRTIGLNLLTARAFGFCYARSASAPLTPVCASMKSEDALQQGESLYLAELRRAKEMLAIADSSQRTVFLIDEIFRGTNHLESVSAGAAVLHALAAKNIVLVSSHNLVLASLLADRLQALRVEAGEDGELLLEPGVMRRTNGIALLRHGGFDPAIEAHAQQVYGLLSREISQPDARATDGSEPAPAPCDV